MRYSLLAALLLALVSTNTCATEKMETFQDENLPADHPYEAVQISDPSKKGIDLGEGWIFTGDIRAGWVDYKYDNPAPGDSAINKGHIDSEGFYVVPKLSIITPAWDGFSAKITGAAATDFGINNEEDESRNFVFDAQDQKSFAILQELYIQYDNNGNKALIGREELSTPMIDTDDWYMQANSFEVAYYVNTMLENNFFAIGYFHKMAGVWDSGANGTEFHSMSDASFVSQEDKDNADDSGVITGVYQYKDDTHNIQVWDYYATDLYNTLFVQYDFTSKVQTLSYDLGVQFINFKEVGKLADNSDIPLSGGGSRTIDYSMYSLRFDGNFENGINFATGATKYTDGEGQGSTLGAWGGYPYFANGMIFHFFEAGSLQNASSYKAQLGYDIMDGLWLGGRYTFWDLDSSKSISSSTGQGQDDMNMYGIRLSYDGFAGTYLTATYEFVDLDQQADISAFRLIGGVKF